MIMFLCRRFNSNCGHSVRATNNHDIVVLSIQFKVHCHCIIACISLITELVAFSSIILSF